MMKGIGISNWLIPLALGSIFTALACLKFYGLHRGIAGGAAKPLAQRLCGT
jgi:hypothetical protein